MKKLLKRYAYLLSLIGIPTMSGCTQVQSSFYWYEHSVNGRMPQSVIIEENENEDKQQ